MKERLINWTDKQVRHIKANRIKYLLAAFLIVLSGVIAEYLFNFEVNNAAHPGITGITFDELEMTGFTVVDGELVLTDSVGTITISWDGSYIDHLDYSFTSTGIHTANILYQGRDSYGEPKETWIADNNSYRLTTSSTPIRDEVDWIYLVFYRDDIEVLNEYSYVEIEKDPALTITGLNIKNTSGFNWNRAFFVWSVAFLAAFFILAENTLRYKVENAFVVTALTLGLLMLVLMPPTKVSWDEEIHYYRSVGTSYLPFDWEADLLEEAYFVPGTSTWPYSLPASSDEQEELKKNLNAEYNSDTEIIQHEMSAGGIYTVGYLTQALFIKVGRLFGMSFTQLYQFGRLGNLLLYIGIMFLAIKITPVGKRILMVIGLMPTTLFLSAVYSYDATVFCFIALGLALVFREFYTPEEALTWKRMLIIGVVLFIGCLPKAIYAPLVLIGLALPASKFKNKKTARLVKALFVLLFIVLVFSFILPILKPGVEVGDNRGGEEVSSVSQMTYILGQPLNYAKVLFTNILNNFGDYVFGQSVFGSMGHLDVTNIAMLTTLIAAAVILTDTWVQVGGKEISRQEFTLKYMSEKRAGLTGITKLWMFLLCGVSAVLIWTALYIVFTAAGKEIIDGVQGRYYIPFLFPLYLVFSSFKLENQISARAYNTGILLSISALMVYMVSYSLLPAWF